MITREQFEAHVRAEAAKGFPLITVTEIDARQIDRRSIYIAARMEYEWPLVEALYAIMDAHGPGTLCSDCINDGAIAALSPYTTKPIDP